MQRFHDGRVFEDICVSGARADLPGRDFVGEVTPDEDVGVLASILAIRHYDDTWIDTWLLRGRLPPPGRTTQFLKCERNPAIVCGISSFCCGLALYG